MTTGGAEKQPIILAEALRFKYNTMLIIYFGEHKDERLIRLVPDGINLVFLTGNHVKRFFQLYQILRKRRNGFSLSYLMGANILNAVIGTAAGVKIRLGGFRNSKYPVWKLIIQRYLHQAFLTGSIVNNERGKQYLIKRGVKATTLFRIHNGIPLEIGSGYKQAPIDSFNILIVARFDAQKDYPTLLACCKKVIMDAKQEVRLIIIGHGALEKWLRNQVKVMGLENHTEIHINPPKIDFFYRKSHIYLSASLFEGVSNSIMEAMTFGLPVFATDVGDNNLLVKHGETGLLFPVKSPEKMAKAIIELLENPEKLKAMGVKGYYHIRSNFSMDNFYNNYVNLLELLEKQVLAAENLPKS
jgi:glycosyltransferase involved in cell wall biosynthesis